MSTEPLPTLAGSNDAAPDRRDPAAQSVEVADATTTGTTTGRGDGRTAARVDEAPADRRDGATSAAGQGSSSEKGLLRRILTASLVPVILVLVLLVVLASAVSPWFLTAFNIESLVRDLAFGGLTACAMALLLLVGELDLSIGAVASLTGVLAGELMVQHGINPWLALVFGLLLAALFGFINGLLTVKLRLNSLVVTIGTTGIYGGIALVLTKGKAITGIPDDILFLGQDTFLGIPIPFYFALAVLVVMSLVLKLSKVGRYVYAIGNSIDAARLLGIKTDRIRIGLFTCSGLIAGLAGLLYVARLGSSQTAIGGAWAMNAIAAGVIGGIALTGGLGSPLGAFIGAAIITVISNIIVLFGVNAYWQSAVSGIVVVVAISISSLSAIIKSRQDRAKFLKAARTQARPDQVQPVVG